MPDMTTDQLSGITWDAIKDFTPGIRGIISPNSPPGTADDKHTYRCIADPSGSLGPAPKLHQKIYPSDGLIKNALIDRDPSVMSSPKFTVAGIHCVDPVERESESLYGTDQNNTELWVGLSCYTNGYEKLLTIARYMRYSATNPRWEIIWRGMDTINYDPTVRPAMCYFGDQRSHPPDYPLEGDLTDADNLSAQTTEVVGVAGGSVTCWVFDGYAGFFPLPYDAQRLPTTQNDLRVHSNDGLLPGDKLNIDLNLQGLGVLYYPNFMVLHQGRFVGFMNIFYAHGYDVNIQHNENIYWSMVNDVQDIDTFLTKDDLDSDGNTQTDPYDFQGKATLPQFFNIIAGYEHPTGYEVAESLTANKLFLIKKFGGALTISGDLNDYTVETLPYVTSSGYAFNRGVTTPLGFMYPVDGSGVWLWEGGDVSAHVTKHMPADFWRPTPDPDTEKWGHSFTQCARWGEYVMFPNNYLFDTSSGGWWRIEDTDEVVIHKWAGDWRGVKVYGAPQGFRNASEPVAYEYDKRELATSFSWRSHPMSNTIDRKLELQEIVLVASGKGIVKVTAFSSDNPEGVSAQFECHDNLILTAESQRLSVSGSHLSFRIESFGAGFPDTSTPAPTVHELRYGVKQLSSLPRPGGG